MKTSPQESQLKSSPDDTPNPLVPLLPGAIPAIRNVKTAKRLLSRLIAAFCRGEIVGQDAKTLAFLLSTYCQITKDHEIEERIDAIEKKLEHNHGGGK
jgi:hypothetical protein